MDILALLAVALLQLAALTFEQLRETVEAVTTVLVEQYIEPVEGTRANGVDSCVQTKGPAM